MSAFRKSVAVALMLQILFSTVGYAITRTTCLVTGDYNLAFNNPEPVCLGKHSAKQHKHESCGKKSRHCCHHSGKQTESASEHKHNCCTTTSVSVHLDGVRVFYKHQVAFAPAVLSTDIMLLPAPAYVMPQPQALPAHRPPPEPLGGRDLLLNKSVLVI
jgi:hypothetical protein